MLINPNCQVRFLVPRALDIKIEIIELSIKDKRNKRVMKKLFKKNLGDAFKK
jgi:hypothetical protein